MDRGEERRRLPRPDPGRRQADAEHMGLAAADATVSASEARRTLLYLLTLSLICFAAMAMIGYGNMRLAPMLYHAPTLDGVAQSLSEGRSYATFDLNIDIRELRSAHIARLPRAPDVAILGASHWQEAGAALLPDHLLYNAHVHRDYYEDMLGIAEIFIRHDRLPKTMILSVRDNLFAPVDARTDSLWKSGAGAYRAMARRLGLRAHHPLATAQFSRARELLSLGQLRSNAMQWFTAPERPRVSDRTRHETLDTLLPDGSIAWSLGHQALFSTRYAATHAHELAAQRRNDPPRIDAAGVAAIDRLIGYLRGRGVEVILAHPPFNPIFYDEIRGTAFERGLRAVERVAASLAVKHGLEIIGSFDARAVGCDAGMYIDAEHANARCLGRILAQHRPFARPLLTFLQPAQRLEGVVP